MANFANVSEDGLILKQMIATHAINPRKIDVSLVLSVVQDIIGRATISSAATNVTEGTNGLVADALEKNLGSLPAGGSGTILEALAVIIQNVCCEFSCKCSGGDLEASAFEVLKMLGNYTWDAKVVITLAAFAVTYGELWLVILLGLDNHPLAKSIAVLKQTPELSEINGVLKPRFAAIKELINIVIDVSKSLMAFESLPSDYISDQDAPLATSQTSIALATYWSIRSIIACGVRITSNIGITSGLVSSTTEAWDLSSLKHKLKSFYDTQLKQKLDQCFEHIKEKKNEEAYTTLVQIYQTTQMDNFRVLKELICPRDDIKPLVKFYYMKSSFAQVVTGEQVDFIPLLHEGNVPATSEQFQIDALKDKTVLLFISDLDVSVEELTILDKFYRESQKESQKQYPYEIVWLPVVDNMTPDMEIKFKELQHKMSWYTLEHPSLLNEVSKKFIREYMEFAKKQIVVSLDPMGNEASHDALHLLMIWGNAAYPFTKAREVELWNKESWRIDFLLASVFPDFNKMVAQPDVHVCCFGGEDIEWIRKFTTSMREQAKIHKTKIELIYIGKPNARAAVRRVIEDISREKIARTLPDVTHVTYFWTRLESMLYKRSQHVSHDNVDNDNIIKQIMSLMSYGSGHDGFAIIGKPGTTEIIQAKGDHIVGSISASKFAETHNQNGLVGAINLILPGLPGRCTKFHCNRVEFPSVEGAGVPMRVTCTDCQRPMEKYILYKCCTGY